MENLSITNYSRQLEMDVDMNAHLRKGAAHIVVGCGGVGFWLAFMLAMNGANRLILCDGQSIESSNLNRIPVPQTWVGINKTIALRRVIKQVRPECQISVNPKHVLNDDGFSLLVELAAEDGRNGEYAPAGKVLWDCTDDARVQKKLAAFCAGRTNYQYRKLGYEGYRMGSYTQMQNVWFDEESYQPGYRTSRANAMSSAMTAALGIFTLGLQHEQVQDITIDIKTLVQSGGRQCTSTNRANTQEVTASPTPATPMGRPRAGTLVRNLAAPTNAVMETTA
jgi:hypothetical protein